MNATIQTISAAVQAGAALIAIVLTIYYVYYTKRLLDVNQALVLAGNTPHISVVMTSTPSNNGSEQLLACEIENVGTGPAYDIEIRAVDPKSPTERYLTQDPHFNNNIDFLAPNHPRLIRLGQLTKTPDIDMVVTVKYKDATGKLIDHQRPYKLTDNFVQKYT